jgi:hypothetical protein
VHEGRKRDTQFYQKLSDAGFTKDEKKKVRFTLRLKTVSKILFMKAITLSGRILLVLLNAARYVPGLRYRSNRKKNRVKMTVLADVESCSLVEVYRRFKDACCFLHQRPDDDEAACTPKTSVNFHQPTRSNKQEDSHLHDRRPENLKSRQKSSAPQHFLTGHSELI